MQEMQVWSLVQEDPLQEETETHTSIIGWRTPWTEESGWQSIGLWIAGHVWVTEHAQNQLEGMEPLK